MLLGGKSARAESLEMRPLSSPEAEVDQIKGKSTKWAIKFDNGEMHRYTDEQVLSHFLLGC